MTHLYIVEFSFDAGMGTGSERLAVVAPNAEDAIRAAKARWTGTDPGMKFLHALEARMIEFEESKDIEVVSTNVEVTW